MVKEKRRCIGFLLICMAVLLLCGCSDQGNQSAASYTIYYKSLSGTSLAEAAYTPAAQTFDELVEELLDEFREAPADELYTSAMPEGVGIQGYEKGIDFLRIDFSLSYYEMNNIEEVLLRAAVVKTLVQIPGVTKVMITVDSEQLVDADGNVVGAMNEDSFIDTKNGGISSYQYATLVLYFPTRSGDKLQKEVREVDYSSNMVLERVIVEQLISGPGDPSCRIAVNPSAEILDVSTKNGICTINFSEEFNQIPTDSAAPSAEAALYAVIDSICSTSDAIDGVKFSIEGQSNLLFWNEIDLNNVFLMNEGIIETEAMAETSASAADQQGVISDSTLAGAEQ